MIETVILNNEEVSIKIIHKNNKNIYFRFDEKGCLVVSAPIRISDKKILKLIKENEKSLVKMMKRKEAKIDNPNEIRILGLKYELKLDGNIPKITIEDGIIYASSKEKIEAYLKNITKQIFIEEINKVLKIMPNIPKFTLKIRKMKTRWGVCNYAKMTVTLNSELIKYERSIIDYVIIHEFSHFTHHNHSKEFWNLVGKYYPDYKTARKELRET